MSFAALILLLIIFNGISFVTDTPHNEYMSVKQTQQINGIFVVLVLLNHYTQYLPPLDSLYDIPYAEIKYHLNQMVVSTFLFFSGYGILKQIEIKGQGYIYVLPNKSIKLLVKFDIAVVLFFILNCFLGYRYTIFHTLLSLLGWESIGNSNWYVFVIIVLYILLFFSFLFSYKLKIPSTVVPIAIFTGFTMVLVLFLMTAGKDSYWYNTAILLPAGMWYAFFKEKIDRIVLKNELTYWVTAIFICGIYILAYLNRWNYGIEGYTIWAFSFVAVIVLLSMKITLDSKILSWFGSHVFSIYILQRLPMIFFNHFGWIDSHRYFSLVAVIIITIFMAIIFDKFFQLRKIDTIKIHVRNK